MPPSLKVLHTLRNGPHEKKTRGGSLLRRAPGYTLPHMSPPMRTVPAGILLGLLWALWHWPVIDFLGTAHPHGAFLLPFFLAFALILTAMRVLMVWTYAHTKSLFLPQLMHISSTGSLVVFGPPHVTAAQETLWYALYGLILSLAVSLVLYTASRRTPKNQVRL